MKARSSFVLLPLLFLAFSKLLEAASVPPDVPPLIKPSRETSTVRESRDPTVIRERNVEVDIPLLLGPDNRRLRLPLFNGEVLELIRAEQEVPQKGTLIWSGIVAKQPESVAVLSVVDGVLFGSISTEPKTGEARFYQIQYLGDRLYALREIDQSKFPPEGSPGETEIRKADDNEADGSGGSDSGAGDSASQEPVHTCTSDSAGRIDALVVYTERARELASGASSIKAMIRTIIKQTNLSYSRSLITQRLRLVHMKEVDYSESNDLKDDRDYLSGKGDGKLEEVFQLRDEYAADIVGLIVGYEDGTAKGCGMARIMEEESNAFESLAYAVVPLRCANGNYSLTHEFGHLMGARHDWHVERDLEKPDDPNKPYKYSHGYVYAPTEKGRTWWRTIMAYDDQCPDLDPKDGYGDCNRKLYWSNPDKRYRGVRMGVSGGDEPADNSRTLNNTAKTVANFRCSRD